MINDIKFNPTTKTFTRFAVAYLHGRTQRIRPCADLAEAKAMLARYESLGRQAMIIGRKV